MQENNTTKINPRLLSGFKDFLPKQKNQRDWLINQIKTVYESFGFQPLETPVLEYADILTGKYGEEANMMMYRFTDQGKRDVAMRYDLTIPFARIIAQYPELPKPFKRYQIAPVWRSDSPQAGRYREFYQFDADIAGSASMLADSEIIEIIYRSMIKIGVKNFNIRLNNRKILNGLLAYADINQTKANQVFQMIDKIEKISKENFRKILTEIVGTDSYKKILDFIQIKGSNTEIIAQLKHLFLANEIGLAGIKEIEEILANLELNKIELNKIKIDLSIARGLDYYTGTVFETVLLDAPEFGSIFSGGRYNELIGLFTNTDIPAIGTSVGIDRLFTAMEKLDLLPNNNNSASALVTVFPENPQDSLKVAQKLRESGLKIETYLGDKTNLKNQLSYADKLSIPVVIITFPDQIEKDNYIVKKMGQNFGETEQIETNFAKLAETIKKITTKKDES
ncbi:MAG: histidine--tRNA ligase [Candidatus Berkelbacteria bacterium]